MADALQALAISGGILLVVVLLFVAISIATVKRGSESMKQQVKNK